MNQRSRSTLRSRPGRRGRHEALAIAGLLAVAGGCSKSGSDPDNVVGGPGPGAAPLVVDFGLRKDLHLGSAFLGDVHHVDLDGDGVQDLVEANFFTSFVTIAFGNPDGTFTTFFELPTTGHAWRLTTGDFGGDGLTDIAVACGDWLDGAQQAIDVFEQGPLPGEFGAAKTLFLDADPKDLAAAPVSGIAGDAGPDELFVALRERHEVLRVRLDGAGQPVATGALDSANIGAAGGPFSLAVVDIGADGLLDLVVGEEDVLDATPDRVVQFLRDDSDASAFIAPSLVLSPVAKPIVDNTGDVDGNGFEDVAIANQGDDFVFLLAADGAGFSQAVALDFQGETTSLLFPDLNGDGLAEAVATVLHDGSIQVRKGVAPMVWDDPVHYNVGSTPRALGVLHLPGDGRLDLLCANAQDLSLLVGVGDARFRAARGYPTAIEDPVALATADLDNDGDMDAVAISQRQQSIAFLEGRGDGTLETRRVLPLVPTEEDELGFLAIADLDGDGLLDVVTTVTMSDEVRVYRGTGDVGAFAEPGPSDVHSVGGAPIGLDVADVNADRVPDIVVANRDDSTLQVLLGMGAGAFSPMAPIALDDAPLGVVCLDLDNDDDLDVLTLSREPLRMHVMSGDGVGGLSMETTYDLPGAIGVGSFASGDFNQDGLLDVAVGQVGTDADTIMLFENGGDLGFTAREVTIGAGPGTLLAADADEDGRLDLLIPTTDGELCIAYGDGQGGFAVDSDARGDLPVPRGTSSACFDDLDGDLLPDLLMVSPRAPFVWVGTNASVTLEQ